MDPDALTCVDTYYGDEDPHVWLEHLQAVADIYHWNEGTCMKVGTVQLRGAAQRWAQQHDFSSWPSFCQQLALRFGDTQECSATYLEQCFQQPFESTQAFADRFLYLAVKAGRKEDPALVYSFTQCLLPELKAEAVRQRLQSITDIAAFCDFWLSTHAEPDACYEHDSNTSDSAWWEEDSLSDVHAHEHDPYAPTIPPSLLLLTLPGDEYACDIVNMLTVCDQLLSECFELQAQQQQFDASELDSELVSWTSSAHQQEPAPFVLGTVQWTSEDTPDSMWRDTRPSLQQLLFCTTAAPLHTPDVPNASLASPQPLPAKDCDKPVVACPTPLLFTTLPEPATQPIKELAQVNAPTLVACESNTSPKLDSTKPSLPAGLPCHSLPTKDNVFMLEREDPASPTWCLCRTPPNLDYPAKFVPCSIPALDDLKPHPMQGLRPPSPILASNQLESYGSDIPTNPLPCHHHKHMLAWATIPKDPGK